MDENQIVEELDYLLPDDYEEEEEEETTETTEAEEIIEEEQTEETDEEPQQAQEIKSQLDDIEIKFLHESKKLKDFNPDELKSIVQKGMNHDRLIDKINVANEKNEKFRELSELYKMSEADLLNALYDQYFTSTAEAEGKDKETIKLRYEAGKKQATQKMYERFAQNYPGVKADEIPQDVWMAVNEGEDLSKAYESHKKENAIKTKENELNQLKSEIEELKLKLKTQQNNESVKKKAVVKSTSKNGSESENGDDFLLGLFGK